MQRLSKHIQQVWKGGHGEQIAAAGHSAAAAAPHSICWVWYAHQADAAGRSLASMANTVQLTLTVKLLVAALLAVLLLIAALHISVLKRGRLAVGSRGGQGLGGRLAAILVLHGWGGVGWGGLTHCVMAEWELNHPVRMGAHQCGAPTDSNPMPQARPQAPAQLCRSQTQRNSQTEGLGSPSHPQSSRAAAG